MADDRRDASSPRVPVRPKDLFDQDNSRVPSPRTQPRAAQPDAAETFPPSGQIPIVPPIFDQADPNATRAVADPVRALGDAAVTGAVTGRGAFRQSTNVSPPPGAPSTGRAPAASDDGVVRQYERPAPPAIQPGDARQWPALASAKPAPAAAPMQSSLAEQAAPAWMSVKPSALVAAEGDDKPKRKAKPKTSPAAKDADRGDHEGTRKSKTKAKHQSEGGAGGGKPPKRPARDAESPVPFFRRLSTLIVIGLLVAVGASTLVATVIIKPEILLLAPRVENIPLPTPAIDPVVPESPTPFLAGLPGTDLTYALTDYQEMTLTDRFLWVGRAAEGWTLTYEDGAGGVMTVTAYQHYDVDAAIAAFEKAAPPAPVEPGVAATISPAPEPEPSPTITPVPRGEVLVGEEVVGESVKTIIPAVPAVPATDNAEAQPAIPERAQIMWRNATAVFIMVAAPAAIDDLFTEYEV